MVDVMHQIQSVRCINLKCLFQINPAIGTSYQTRFQVLYNIRHYKKRKISSAAGKNFQFSVLFGLIFKKVSKESENSRKK